MLTTTILIEKTFIYGVPYPNYMGTNRTVLEEKIERGETKDGEIEFKSELEKDVHLKNGKRESLAAQMRYRVMSGDGKATYVVGVSDNGDIEGLKPDKFSETLDVLSLLASEVDVHIEDVETWNTGKSDKLVGLATIKEGQPVEHNENHLIIGTAGHVDHGKSTLVGSLMTGERDNGEGSTRSYLDVKPHEIERGLSADISYAVYGFKNDKALTMDNPNRNNDRSSLVEQADKLVSFVDTVGHKPWLRTTIRGLVGQKIDYGLLTVAADDGPTETTKEHLGLLIATELPVIVCITKTDMVEEERVEEVERNIEQLLRQANRTPLLVNRHGVESAVDEISPEVVPILRTSAVTMEGFDDLNYMMKELEPRETGSSGCQMYIDKVYNIDGVGPVVSGTVQSGVIETGDEIIIGPLRNGEFREVKARSIEIHYYGVDKAKEGQIASIAVSDVDIEEVERGMVLLPSDSEPSSTKRFEAEVMVLNHPTKITEGYEPVIHLETISETAVISPNENQMMAGDKGLAEFEFKFSEHYVEEGQKFVFREGKSKGVGKIKRIID
jgi:elongation factor 1-alpha